MSKPTIKYVGIKNKNLLKGSVGTYDNDRIYIYKKLPKYVDGTRRLTVEHELAHWRNRTVDLRAIFGSPKDEEKFIEMCGIANTPNKNLSFGETIIKQCILAGGKLKFNKKSDRRKIFEHILRIINADMSKLDILVRMAK